MTGQEIKEYYDATTDSEPRASLREAVKRVPAASRIAIDCGCGAGSNIAFLRGEGFTVHAFDIEAEAINRCRQRFAADADVHLVEAGFSEFSYPPAGLVVADASLFFCRSEDFPDVWAQITGALVPHGLFVGAFLGPRDTMAGPGYDGEAFWPDVMTLTENDIRALLTGFEILDWEEIEVDGETAQGAPHHWHIFSVSARKLP